MIIKNLHMNHMDEVQQTFVEQILAKHGYVKSNEVKEEYRINFQKRNFNVSMKGDTDLVFIGSRRLDEDCYNELKELIYRLQPRKEIDLPVKKNKTGYISTSRYRVFDFLVPVIGIFPITFYANIIFIFCSMFLSNSTMYWPIYRYEYSMEELSVSVFGAMRILNIEGWILVGLSGFVIYLFCKFLKKISRYWKVILIILSVGTVVWRNEMFSYIWYHILNATGNIGFFGNVAILTDIIMSYVIYRKLE